MKEMLEMALYLYNTLSRKIEEFKPLKDKIITIYSCGPTVYDSPHIGHGRHEIIMDSFTRFLEYIGYEVRYVENITDIDDKIIAKAEKMGLTPGEVALIFTLDYFEQMGKLGVRRAWRHPQATNHIQEMIEVIKSLIEKGYAYEVDGDVYFSVNKFKEYGKLSKQDINSLRKGARVEIDERKKDPIDFALWKKSKPNEPAWSSPWGMGRCGWHIECSVMSIKYLGETIDIHAGGEELIFPHHENEIAQSEAYTGKPFVRYWMHHGLITIKAEKMAKSIGNVILISELLERYDADTFRYFVLSAHYRNPLEYSEESMIAAQNTMNNVKRAIKKIEYALSYPSKESKEKTNIEIEKFKEEIIKELSYDFNTPKALALLIELTYKIADNANKINPEDLKEYLKIIKELWNALGFFQEKKLDKKEILIENLLKIILEIREIEREKKNYELSDSIREKLRKLGIEIEDTPYGTFWFFK
ncbi:MAG: cysteine--tRNA ligase [Nitrososphaerota archaeon]